MAQSPEMQQRLAILRQKQRDGTIDIEEMKEAILMLKGDRRNAATVSEQSKRVKAKKEVKSADELLAQLGNL